MKKTIALLALLLLCATRLRAADTFITYTPQPGTLCLTDLHGTLLVDPADWKGVHLAAANLSRDLDKVTGRHDLPILVGTWGKSTLLSKAAKAKLPDGTKLKTLLDRELKGRREKYLILWTGRQLLIAGSDKRGTIYGIYELSQQIGVSPWWDWADVPVLHRDRLYLRTQGRYTDGEPAVRYRGIFLNDEAPCLSSWVQENYGGVYDHRFYARVFELVLRLRGNYMWPAMWNSAFYADDPLNLQTADDMGVIMGTSHHEPMARAHKEWTRQRGRGPWNFDENQAELDTFWLAGVQRMKATEDVVTIGMRGNGDEPMGKNADVALLERIVDRQRTLIQQATQRPASQTPQVWALYKEVQEYYEKGMRVPDDVILLLCDDNWGNVRILPELEAAGSAGVAGSTSSASPTGSDAGSASPWAQRHPGGYGLYYHVDYVGGPRNSKFLNVSQVQRMWEQLQLTYTYGVDQLWILNVGDLKPMELPIDFWFRMAWNPSQFRADNLQGYTEAFCRQQLGEAYATEAARLLNLQCKYAHRRTPELLDHRTYSLASGEWQERVDEYDRLERDATILRDRLDVRYRATYDELIYTPVRLMANLYRLYFAVAQNRALFQQWSGGTDGQNGANGSNGLQAKEAKGAKGADKPSAAADSLLAAINQWAERAELAFRRDGELCDSYHRLLGGKWNHMMREIHIGYTSWNGPRQNRMPQVHRIDPATGEELADAGNQTGSGQNQGTRAGRPQNDAAAGPARSVEVEADAFESKRDAAGATWQVIPDMGIYRCSIALLPYTAGTEGAALTYRFTLPSEKKEGASNEGEGTTAERPLSLELSFATTFPFNSGRGQRVEVSLDGAVLTTLNINEASRYIRDGYHDQNYQWETTRRNLQRVDLPALSAGTSHTVTLRPLDPGVVFQHLSVR